MFAMTSIKGIGRRFANLVCKKADVDMNKRKSEIASGLDYFHNIWIVTSVTREEHRGLTKQECRDLYKEYKKEKAKIPREPESSKALKSRIRCSLHNFRAVLKGLTDTQEKVIAKTPFSSLLDLKEEGLSQQPDLIKSIVRHFDSEKMTLTIRKGGETKDFIVTEEDFSSIMGIRNGEGPLLDAQNVELDDDLVRKFCFLGKKEKYKYIDIKKVQEELKNATDDNAIKQTFALIALHYIVCPAPAGKSGKKLLWYVKDANSLHVQPWVTVAMNALKHGIHTYKTGAGAEKSLGGCVLFLQLYCMKTRGFMEGMNVSQISKEVAEKFYKNWMIDHAPEKKRQKHLVEKICKDGNTICKDLKDLYDLIKVQQEKVGLQSLLDLDAFNESCKNMIASSTSGLMGSDQAASLVIEGPSNSAQNADSGDMAASTSHASRSAFYPDSNDKHHVKVSYSDTELLQPSKCLNDNLMNFYLRYLELTNGAKCHFFNTFFYPKLEEVLQSKEIAENPFKSFRKWWDKDNIFQKEYIVIPIHGYFHWSVVIVCMRNKIDKSEPILLHLDSNSTHDTAQIFANIKRFIEEELNHGSIKGIVHRIDDTVRCEVPNQQNAYDCGLYALLCIENFIKQAPNRMESEYTTMFGKKWFQEKEVGDLRSRMKNILTSFLKSQNLKTYRRQNKKPDDAPSNTLENAGKESGDDAPITPKVKTTKPRLNQVLELRRLGKNPEEQIEDLSKRKLRERPKKPKGEESPRKRHKKNQR